MESAALNTYFQAGFQGEDSDDDDDELAKDVDNDEDSNIVDNTKTHDALAWADNFMLKTQRRGGHQTENSVLKQWKVCKTHRGTTVCRLLPFPEPAHCAEPGIPCHMIYTGHNIVWQ